MELLQVFMRVAELSGKYPCLDREELKELSKLSRGLSLDCQYLIDEMDENNKKEI